MRNSAPQLKLCFLEASVTSTIVQLRWWCHFDDDTYVNIPALKRHLQQFNPEKERLYMGHFPSIWGKRSVEVSERPVSVCCTSVCESEGNGLDHNLTCYLYVDPRLHCSSQWRLFKNSYISNL